MAEIEPAGVPEGDARSFALPLLIRERTALDLSQQPALGDLFRKWETLLLIDQPFVTSSNRPSFDSTIIGLKCTARDRQDSFIFPARVVNRNFYSKSWQYFREEMSW